MLVMSFLQLILLGLMCSQLESFVPIYRNRMVQLRGFYIAAALQQSISNPFAGTVAVSGVGEQEKDEFLLQLLSEQNIWKSVRLGLQDTSAGRKRFLTRTARYSGLLNILDFSTVQAGNDASISQFLAGSDAWLALNVPQESIVHYAKLAVTAGIKRALFTLLLPVDQLSATSIPEFEEASSVFSAAGGAFTGIRHGAVIEGAEDRPYAIVNATTPCSEGTVERGVLARVASELLRTEEAYGQTCGVSSASSFEAAYLNILRSTGLSRQQEVRKVFAGGVERVAQLTARVREAEQKRVEEKLEADRKTKEAEQQAARQERNRSPSTATGGAAGQPPRTAAELADGALNVDFDADPLAALDELEVPEETLINIRANEILTGVWVEMNARMMSKATSKAQFFESNMHRALDLAAKELNEQTDRLKRSELQREAVVLQADHVGELERQQYAKLLTLQRRELLHQKQMSDTWVRYIHLLLERTMDLCAQESVVFHTLGALEQTLRLRAAANALRAGCRLPAFDAVYDPVDAEQIVAQLAGQEEQVLKQPVELVAAQLQDKYGSLLETLPALRAAKNILELSLDTIRMDLPSPPIPVVDVVVGAGSAAAGKAAGSTKPRRRNGNPISEDESVMGTV